MANIFTDILDDKVFKVVFGDKLGRNNMINFLRALLPDLGITEIEYLNCEQMGLSPEEGKSVFDLSVLTGDGSRVIVEMQTTNLRYFNYRSVYYTSHAVQLQAARERDRQRTELIDRNCKPFWNYWFPPVYFIAVLKKGMGGARAGAKPSSGRQGDGRPPYIKEFRLREKNSGEDLGVELNYIYLCLDRFDKSAEESKDPVDRFMYSLKNITELEEMPRSFVDSGEMVELYERSMTANLPDETIHEIEIHKNMTTENDILVALAEAREDAALEATAKALPPKTPPAPKRHAGLPNVMPGLPRHLSRLTKFPSCICGIRDLTQKAFAPPLPGGAFRFSYTCESICSKISPCPVSPEHKK